MSRWAGRKGQTGLSSNRPDRPAGPGGWGEGKGIRRLVSEHCDALISIPMVGHVASLNVSVTTAIVLYEVLRQRSK